jgi:methionyl-tRNA formyltransferase
MKIVFFGSDDFAAIHLESILNGPHEVVGVVTQPDKPQGRGMKIALSPLKEIALKHDLICLQPESLKDPLRVEQLKSLQADLFVVVAYGQILTSEVLALPKIFCINVHGSLLPQYRGAAPINWAILNGDKETGVTIQKMVLELDAGDIIAQEKMIIGLEETSAQLRSRMAMEGAKLLVQTLDKISKGQHHLAPQDPHRVSYAPKLSKDMGKIDWNRSAVAIHNQIRGLLPWPGTYTSFKGKALKILEASIVSGKGAPGTILDISKQGFTIACGQEALLIKRVHMEAAKPVLAYDFIQGYRLSTGERLQ